ncbi:MAG: MCE family protein [Marmoricola sp.]
MNLHGRRLGRMVRILLGLLLGSVVLSGCDFDVYSLPLPGGTDVGDNPITVTVQFQDVLDLVPKSTVKVNDVSVGMVKKIDLEGYHANVTIELRNDTKLPENTIAEIRQTSLLGEKFVSLSPPETGAEGTLTDGEVIPLDRTGRNPEVEEVLGALSFVLSGGGVQQLRTISVEINKMLNGRTDDARGVLSQVTSLVGALDDQKASILNAMQAVDKLSVTLNKESRSVGAAIDALGPALKVLNGQHRSLVKMLRELDKLGVVGTKVIKNSKDDMVAALRHLAPPLRELADAGNSLPRGLSLMASFPFPKEAADLAQGDYANALFAVDFDLSKLLGSGGVGDSSNIPNPVQICLATPAAPICKTLNDSLLTQLCSLAPTNPLCPGTGPGAKADKNNPIGTLLNGILGGGTSGSTPRRSDPGSGGLLGGLASLLGGGRG